jgi:hypothetical protein
VIAMGSLFGIWKLVEARAFDDAGRELPPPFGLHPIGTVTFEAERMAAVVADGRVSLPPDAPPRLFVAYTGAYRFDEEMLVTRADDASNPELIIEQVRRIRFESPTRVVAIPVSGVPGRSGIELLWERIG